MNTLLDALDCGLLLLGEGGRIEQVNRWLLDRCRHAQPAPGQALDEAFGAPVEPRLLQAVRNCLAHGNASRLSQAFHPTPLPLFHPDEPDTPGATDANERLRQAVDVIAIEDPATRARHCLVQVRDVSDTVRREQTLRSQAQQLSNEVLQLSMAQEEIERQSLRFSEMARLAPVGLLESNARGVLVFSNARVAEQLGLDTQPFLGQPWPCLLQAAGHTVDAGLASRDRPAFEFALVRGGLSTWLRLEGTPLQTPGQSPAGHLFTLVDVTELREQARRNEVRANHDGLTGLANRARFEARLQEAVLRCRQAPRHAYLMFIDLDRFKAVNDTLGHQAGDAVLKAVAARLRRCVRGEDLVARLGGDEFAVLLDDLADEAVVRRVGASIEAAVGEPVAAGNGLARVGASIGWTLLDTATPDAAAALATADEAMYRVKRDRHAADLPLARTG